MGSTINRKDNSKEVKAELDRKIQIALKMIGERAEEYAKKDCPVDTGRLINSLTYATATENGAGKGAGKDSKPHGKPEKDSVYIGTNVEYAEYVEFNEIAHHNVGRAHFLRDAAATHGKEYKNIAQNVLENM